MTEEEARTKWCPHVRFVIDSELHAFIGNRFEKPSIYNDECLCIASECMLWLPDAGFQRTGNRGHCGLINSI